VVTAGGITIDRLADGKVAESWISLDALNLLRQLGAAPTLRPMPERPHPPFAPGEPDQ
jgi:hypothetical protein